MSQVSGKKIFSLLPFFSLFPFIPLVPVDIFCYVMVVFTYNRTVGYGSTEFATRALTSNVW